MKKNYTHQAIGRAKALLEFIDDKKEEGNFSKPAKRVGEDTSHLSNSRWQRSSPFPSLPETFPRTTKVFPSADVFKKKGYLFT